MHIHVAVLPVRGRRSLALMSLINKVLINDQGICIGDSISGIDAHCGCSERWCSCRHPNHDGLRGWLPEDSVHPQLPRVNPHGCVRLLPHRKQCRALCSTGLVLHLFQDWTIKCTLNSSGPRSCLRMLVISDEL